MITHAYTTAEIVKIIDCMLTGVQCNWAEHNLQTWKVSLVHKLMPRLPVDWNGHFYICVWAEVCDINQCQEIWSNCEWRLVAWLMRRVTGLVSFKAFTTLTWRGKSNKFWETKALTRARQPYYFSLSVMYVMNNQLNVFVLSVFDQISHPSSRLYQGALPPLFALQLMSILVSQLSSIHACWQIPVNCCRSLIWCSWDSEPMQS